MKENNKRKPSEENETRIYLTPDSTLQTPEEKSHDESVDPRKDNTISVSRDDLNETEADRYVGSDRAGTSERKDNSLDQPGS